MTWRPLLEGEDADRAREAIDAIRGELAARAIHRPDLDNGQAGQALLHAYAARSGDAQAAERAVAGLEGALAGLGEVPGPWLFNGLGGIAWTIAHLADLVDIDEETFAELDGLIARVLSADPWPFHWEHVAGLVGLGAYALERRCPTGAAMRARVVGHLARLAERSDAGATWRSPPPRDRTQGSHDLGLAHGVAGIIGFLAGAVDAPGADELLGEAVRWMLRHDSGDPRGRFPYELAAIPDKLEHRQDGWCYGDQAVAVVLVRAGQALGEPAWIERGRAVALDVARREPAPLEVSFCHGTLGRAHIFNRLAQATGCEELAEAARRWYCETIRRRRPGSGIGGYQSERGRDWDASVVIGATGIALGLIAASTPEVPAWDRLFLLSARPD